MDIKAIALLFVAISNFILASIIYQQNIPKIAYNIFYSFFAFFVGLWAFSMMMFRSVADMSYSIFWMKLTYVSAVGIACSFLYFILFFPKNKKLKKITNFFICTFSLIMVILILSNNFLVQKVILLPWGKEVITSKWAHFIFAIYFISFFFGAISFCLYKYRNSTGIIRDQFRYIFFGIAIPGVLGTFFNLAIPLFFNTHRLTWLGPLFTIIMVIFIAYAITRYRLMDIRIVVRKSFIYFLAAVFSYCFFYFAAWLLINMFGSIYATGAFIFGIVIAIVFAILFFSVEKIIRLIANRYFFSALYSQHETLRQVSEKLTAILDVEELLHNVNDVIRRTLAVDKIAFVLKNEKGDKYKARKQNRFKKNDLEGLFKTKKIVRYFAKNSNPLAIEETGNRELSRLKEKMKIVGADLLLPLTTKHGLQGIVVLGKKVNGDSFSKEDIELLRMLATQTALAIENASLYDGMEKIIEKQTENIRVKNVKLRKLLGLKTEFLRIASHQLRTPVSAIKGLVSMFQEGDFDKADKKTRKKAFEGIFQKTSDMAHILDDILIASELDSKKKYQLDKIRFKEVDLGKMTEKTISSLKYLAKEKKIKISYVKKNGAFPMISGDEKSISQIMGNLLDNAIIYTRPNGKIKISIQEDKIKKQVIWTIEDTGIGIPKSSQAHIFDKFRRSKNANLMNRDGSGLGLFIVKALVEAHKGSEVGFTSKEGEGSTFWVAFKRRA